jgi:hypothetical protein
MDKRERFVTSVTCPECALDRLNSPQDRGVQQAAD